MYYFGKSANIFIEYVTSLLGIQDFVSRFEGSWIGFFFTFSALVMWMILMFFYFSLFKFFWLIVGSPVFAYLSEKTAAIIEGRDFPFSLRQLLNDIARGVKVALRNSFWQTFYTLGLLLLSLFPLIGWTTPILSILIECYYYGFSMIDYSCERRKMSAASSIKYVGRHKGLAIGNGIVFYLMHMIIGIGWILAPSYAVVAATISMYETES
jgi:CysZ protein